MLSIKCSGDLYEQFLVDMRGEYEHVGFFLAGFSEGVGFELLKWRFVPPEGFDWQTTYHVTLSDDAQSKLIQWALSLVSVWWKRTLIVSRRSRPSHSAIEMG